MDALPVVDLKNKKVGELTLEESVFAYPLKRHLIYEAVTAYLEAGRAGTRGTKTRDEIAGSGRKLWKQKKTGRARVGSIRSSIWRKGGTVHGPQPYDYENRFPRKMRINAIRSVLASKLRQDRLRLVENFDLQTHRTRDLLACLEALKIGGKVLLVDEPVGRNLDLASRNLSRVAVGRASGLNVFDLLDRDVVVLTRAAAEKIAEVYAP